MLLETQQARAAVPPCVSEWIAFWVHNDTVLQSDMNCQGSAASLSADRSASGRMAVPGMSGPIAYPCECRRRLLSGRGWLVLSVPFYEYYKLESVKAKVCLVLSSQDSDSSGSHSLE